MAKARKVSQSETPGGKAPERAEFYDRSHALPEAQTEAYEAAQLGVPEQYNGRTIYRIDPVKAGWLAAVTRPRPDSEILHIALPWNTGREPPHTWHPVQRFTQEEMAGTKIWFARPVIFPETLPQLAALERAHGSDRFTDYARESLTAEPVPLEAAAVMALSDRAEVYACQYRGLWLPITRREHAARVAPEEIARQNGIPIAMV